MANWYCRVLRPGREIQQQLMHIDSVARFEAIVEEMRGILAARAGEDFPEADFAIRVPSGPIEHW